MNSILKSTLALALGLAGLAEGRPVLLSEVSAKNAHCLMGDYAQTGIIPQLRRLTLPQVQGRIALLKGSDLFGKDRWVARTSYTSVHYPGAYRFLHLYDTSFYRRGQNLQIFNNADEAPTVGFVAKKVPFIYYKKWSPKYDASKSLVASQSTASEFYVELENEPGPVEFENTSTDLMLDLKVPLEGYVACLKTAVKELEAISAR